MKVVKAITILLFGPILGILAGFLVGVIAMPVQTLSGGRAPGDGFLMMGCLALGLCVSVPLSLLFAGTALFGSSAKPDDPNSARSTTPVGTRGA
jgi:hypothetical protein